ncbi:hypothetical protein IKO_03454 [Bacillus cereus VDM034]|nr:hypothetical protein IKO_03454 [Bacillus cereus VDM034]
MWKNLILEIEKVERSFNDKLNTPATDTEIGKLRERVKENFNVDLPSEYEEFLKTVNGLDFSGEVIHDIIDNNKKPCKTGLYYSSSLFCFSNSTNFWIKICCGICISCSSGTPNAFDRRTAVSGEICNGLIEVPPFSYSIA